MVATATDELPLTREGTHCVDAVERWTTRLGGGTTLINICNGGLKENRDVHMKGDKRRKKREREETKGANSGHGEDWGNYLLTPNQSTSQFLPPGEVSYLPLTCSQFCHLSISFALLLLGCRLPQHALVPVPGG